MRAAFRNTLAAAVAAAIAVSGVTVADAAEEVQLAPVRTNTATLIDSDGDGIPDRIGTDSMDGSAYTDDSDSANYNESLEPDWFNPFRG